MWCLHQITQIIPGFRWLHVVSTPDNTDYSRLQVVTCGVYTRHLRLFQASGGYMWCLHQITQIIPGFRWLHVVSTPDNTDYSRLQVVTCGVYTR